MTMTDPTTEPVAQHAPWKIDSDGKAQWALRKLGRRRQERDRLKAEKKAELDRIALWAAEALAPVERGISHYEEMLEGWTRQRIEAAIAEVCGDPHAVPTEDQWKQIDGKTYKLPFGKLTAQRRHQHIVVTDEPAFVAWALKNAPELLSISSSQQSINRAALLMVDERVATSGGEVIPGLAVAPAHLEYGAVPSKDEQPAWLPDPEGYDEHDFTEPGAGFE